MQKVLWESETITRKIMAGLIKLEVVFSFLATKLCLINSFCNPCENGIEIEVTQEEERIGPNYTKLVKRFFYNNCRILARSLANFYCQ